jgi:hypothetical protein
MTRPDLEISPQPYARTGGILYLFIIVAALFGEIFVRGTLIVPLDAAATAHNVQASETLFRIGLAGEMLTCACDVALAMILYVLLRPVHRNLALLAAFFRLTFVAIYGVAKLFEITALVLLGKADYLNAFEPRQLHALAYVALRVHSLGYGVALLFFGVCCALFGDLIYRSTYLPKLLGVLLEIAGLGYVLFSLAQMLAPDFAGRVLFPWLVLPAFPAELGLCLWLTIRGVDVPKWRERAGLQAAAPAL